MDEQAFVTRTELESAVNRVEDRMTVKMKEIETEVKEHAKCIAKVETVLASFEDLPSILSSLNITLVKLDGRLCNVENGIIDLKKKTSCQDDLLGQIDEKGKIDWIEAIKKNWWVIMMFIAAVIFFMKSQGVF